jgi:predicted SprT family Zn-dependent metalloprotease
MPVAKQIAPRQWKYQCECGCEIILEMDTDNKPDLLIRCFECGKKKLKESKKS